jgi:uncharacterized protein YjiS (DUF1127 family)
MSINTSTTGFMALALQPWQLFFGAMTRRKTYAALSALDDHLLKDIGISRGEIEHISRSATSLYYKHGKQPTPGQLRAVAGSRLLLPTTGPDA